ncbi:MAG: alpha/beta hydrolase [Hyphomicrobium sp. 32-62-53]|nr:MAG: alpha/beta hydrolase [Hyphomicrobium sp. 12-62-95]OYX99280.1 MAG: alpha/beta hydrolase [Hyphomicrobium sp. 32-62-53]
MRLDLPTFLSGGVTLSYLDEGDGAARTLPVLLIHGFASSIEMNWIAPGWVRDLTAQGYRVVAIDNRGHGQSEKLYAPECYSREIMAEDASRLLDNVGISQAHVIGYSMGARIAATLALAHPERIGCLVLGGLGHNMVRAMAGTGPIAQALLAPSIDDVVNPTARTFRAFAEQTKSDLKALAVCVRQIRDPVPREEIARISAPTLVAVGTNDVIAGPAEILSALIPGSEAFEIVGRDHMKAVGDRSFKTAVLDFLERHPGVAG